MSTADTQHAWPGTTLARIPFWVYQDEANYRAELRRIFEGPAWNYMCLEADIERARCRSSWSAASTARSTP